MTDPFAYSPNRDGILDPLSSVEMSGPPATLAYLSLGAGIVASVLALLLSGSSALVGYVVGAVGLLVGVAYRVHSHRKQTDLNYVPNIRLDRVMLLGVALSFVGLVGSAFAYSQHPTV